MKPFVILGAPRSRTFWLARFLSTPARPVMHELTAEMKSHDDIRAFFRHPGAAAADTALGLIWKGLEIKGVTTVVVHRPAKEIKASLRKLGMSTKGIEHYTLMLWGIPGHHINADDLDNEVAANALYRLCVGRDAPAARWRKMHAQNLQVDMDVLRRRVQANVDGLRAIYREAPTWH